MELEAELATKPDLYLALQVEPPELEIRARGITLERVALRDVAFLVRQPAWTRAADPLPVLPLVWAVAEPPAGVRREIEPEKLEPFEPEALAKRIAEPRPEAAPLPEAPSTYRVPVGPQPPDAVGEPWTLFVTSELPGTSPWSRPFRLLTDGWRRFRGEPPPPPRLLCLVMEPEAARALHHLMRKDTRLLLLGPDT